MLITILRKVGYIPFEHPFMTGNLRTVLNGGFDAVFPPERSAALYGAFQFRVVGLTCAGFLAGAVVG